MNADLPISSGKMRLLIIGVETKDIKAAAHPPIEYFSNF